MGKNNAGVTYIKKQFQKRKKRGLVDENIRRSKFNNKTKEGNKMKTGSIYDSIGKLVAVVFVIPFMLIVGSLYTYLVGGYVISILYDWFIPTEVINWRLDMWQSAGILVIVHFVTHNTVVSQAEYIKSEFIEANKYRVGLL